MLCDLLKRDQNVSSKISYCWLVPEEGWRDDGGRDGGLEGWRVGGDIEHVTH